MEQGEPLPKKLKHALISEHVLDDEFQRLFKKHWNEQIPIKTDKLEVIIQPFRVCKISNFISSAQFIDEVKEELHFTKCRRDSIDLYQMEQSVDFANVNSESIKTLYGTFETDLAHWLEKNTNIELGEGISMTSSSYTDTDFLLCHDDNLNNRRIAYILYMSEDWKEEDGGTLDLFDTNEDGLPKNIVRSLVPEFNSLLFFEVVHNSYHQVAEVKSATKCRWSINGWFNGPILEQKERLKRPVPILKYIEAESNPMDLGTWISSIYLLRETMRRAQKQIEKDSHAQFCDFMEPSMYRKLSEEIESDSIRWNRVGPANLRNYEVADENSLTGILAEFYKLFKSTTFFQLLKDYTELDLISDGESMHPTMTIELQRWVNGSYTLISDKSTKSKMKNKKKVASSKGLSTETECDSDALKSESQEDDSDAAKGGCSTVKKFGRKRLNSDPFNVIDEDEDTTCYPILHDEYDVNTIEIGHSNNDAEADLNRGECSTSGTAKARNVHEYPILISDDNSEDLGTMTPPSSDEEPAARCRTVDLEHLNRNRTTSSQSLTSPPHASSSQRDLSQYDKDPSDMSGISDYLSDPHEHSDMDEEKIIQQNMEALREFEDKVGFREGEEESGVYGEDAEEEEDVQADEEDGAEADAEADEALDDEDDGVPCTLDTIIQFHTKRIGEESTIDYIDPRVVDGALVHVPCKDNSLSLVYKSLNICRLQRYVNHYCKGYFYNLICTYRE